MKNQIRNLLNLLAQKEANYGLWARYGRPNTGTKIHQMCQFSFEVLGLFWDPCSIHFLTDWTQI